MVNVLKERCVNQSRGTVLSVQTAGKQLELWNGWRKYVKKLNVTMSSAMLQSVIEYMENHPIK